MQENSNSSYESTVLNNIVTAGRTGKSFSLGTTDVTQSSGKTTPTDPTTIGNSR